MRATELLDADELLRLMDRNMVAVYAADARATPGGEVVETDGLVLCRTPHGTVSTNMAIVTGPIDADTVRRLTDEVYGRHDAAFAVWTREHADAALDPALERRGFHQIHREPGMIFLPDDDTRVVPQTDAAIVPVTDAEGCAHYGRLMARAFALYGAPEDSVVEHFATLAAVCGPTTQAFLAWRDGHAVAGATLYMAHDVGGIGWVGTSPDAFRRGYGQAVTRAVIAEGFRRGARFMNLQASPMGEPMYRRMGFRTPTHYRWFLGPA